MTILSQDFDQLTGLKTTIGVEDGKFKVNYAQDISGHLERNRALREEDAYAKQGIKNNLQHVGHIPDSVCLKMMVEEGFDVYEAKAEEVFAFLRKHRDKYGRLLVTRGAF